MWSIGSMDRGRVPEGVKRGACPAAAGISHATGFLPLNEGVVVGRSCCGGGCCRSVEVAGQSERADGARLRESPQ